MITRKYRITFAEEVLGMVSANADVYDAYIASKAPEPTSREEELDALPEQDFGLEQSVFPRDDAGRPIAWDYQIKGLFKDACGMLRRVKGTESSKFKAYKKEIDGLIFVFPRKIAMKLPDGGEIGTCQRPLRAATAQGERVALASSETLPAGTTCEFEVQMMRDELEPLVEEWLAYGELRGFGQWRNSGKGRFACERVG